MTHFLKIINAYLHDFASAMWVSTVVVIYISSRYTSSPEVGELIYRIKKEFFIISIISLGIIILTGIGRTIAYRSTHSDEREYKKRKIFLIIKHIIGFIIYGLGTYWQYRVVYG